MPGETRVALTPRLVETLAKSGAGIIIESGAGQPAGYHDADYVSRGAKLATRAEVFAQASIVAQVRTLGANPAAGVPDLPLMRAGQILIGLAEPYGSAEQTVQLATRGVTLFALELIPRTTRAQSMDVLSSMASLAGYKAVLLAANELPKILPMMTTAAGTISPARALVLGAGVAGLQAIATARRLGAVVSGYDVRAVAREQVESLGARFVVLEGVETGTAEGQGGYAKAMDEAFYQRQRAALAAVIADMDIVISTAAVPGRQAPLLVTAEAVAGMAPGSVVVDLAAERGGNCALTKAGETVVTPGGVRIVGPVNVPATLPYHASQMFAANLTAFIKLMVNKGELNVPWQDDIIRQTAILRDGAKFDGGSGGK